MKYDSDGNLIEEEEGASNEDMFPRSHVEKLRRESQTRREALKPWTDAFQGYAKEDIAIIQEAHAAALSEDPAVAAQGVQQLENINAVLAGREVVDFSKSETETDIPASKEPEVSDTNQEEVAKPLTSEDIAALVASTVSETLEKNDKSRREEQARDDAMTKLDAEMTELGFEPNSFEGKMLLVAARDETEGDLVKAAEYLKDRDQKHIDSVLGDDAATKDKFPKTAPTKGAPQSEEEAPKILTIADAEAAVRADLIASAGETSPTDE